MSALRTVDIIPVPSLQSLKLRNRTFSELLLTPLLLTSDHHISKQLQILQGLLDQRTNNADTPPLRLWTLIRTLLGLPSIIKCKRSFKIMSDCVCGSVKERLYLSPPDSEILKSALTLKILYQSGCNVSYIIPLTSPIHSDRGLILEKVCRWLLYPLHHRLQIP